jgi:excisionase family DNA binding protein
MFYSIQETAEKLGITEDAVKQLARDGKLREFRDGESIMFKVEEVDNVYDREAALKFDVLDETPTPEGEPEAAAEAPAADLDLPLSFEEESVDGAEAPADDLDALLAFTDDEEIEEEPAAAEPVVTEPPAEVTPAAEVKDEGEAKDEAEAAEIAAIDEDLDLMGLDDVAISEDEPQIDLLSDTQAASDEPAPAAAEESATNLDDILMSDSASPAAGVAEESSLELIEGLDDDTAITGEGVNVLGETDGDYQLTDDTMAETLAGLGATGEASIEEIEEDVNLDSFGSGSGLLDLSLQADDTSLGGILDEIYTSDDDEAPAPDTEQATTEGMSAEMDQMPTPDMPEPEMAMAPIRASAAAAEIEPDASSNTLGALLFVPLLLAIYTAIVSLYATVTEGQLVAAASAIKGFFWIIMGGLFVVALVWAIVGFAKGSSGSAKPKVKKAKKEKKAKKPKEKKAKKEKKPKEKKPKKGLFGKKK